MPQMQGHRHSPFSSAAMGKTILMVNRPISLSRVSFSVLENSLQSAPEEDATSCRLEKAWRHGGLVHEMTSAVVGAYGNISQPRTTLAKSNVRRFATMTMFKVRPTNAQLNNLWARVH